MLRRCLAVVLHTAGMLALSGSLAGAYAVELGEVVVRSHIGQPLVADIELTGLASQGAVVDARLAHPDVFKGANLGMHPVLANLRMSVMRRDGGQYLRITSTAPVQTQYVHLFIDLGEGGRREVRQASLPLTPDPRPAPPPAAPVVAPVVAPVAVLAKAVESKPTPAAVAPKPVAATPAPKIIAPVVKPLEKPVEKAVEKPVEKPAAKPAEKPVVAPVAKPVVKPPVKPVIAAAPLAAPAASCPKPRYSDEEVRACATRDYQNAMLSAQIVELEEKVKALQAALDAPAFVGPPAPVKVAAAKPAKLVPPPIRTAPRKKAAAADEPSLPWIWIGAGLAAFAAVAGAAMVVVKRRKQVKVIAPVRPKSNMLGRLRDAVNGDKAPSERLEPVDEAPEKVTT